MCEYVNKLYEYKKFRNYSSHRSWEVHTGGPAFGIDPNDRTKKNEGAIFGPDGS